MKFNIGTIFVSPNNFEALMKLKNTGKYKNFSHVLDEVINNYITVCGQNQKLVSKIQDLVKENTNLHHVLTNYRGQIVEKEASK